MKLGDVVRIRKPGRPKIGVITGEFVERGSYEVTFKDLSKAEYAISELVVMVLSKPKE